MLHATTSTTLRFLRAGEDEPAPPQTDISNPATAGQVVRNYLADWRRLVSTLGADAELYDLDYGVRPARGAGYPSSYFYLFTDARDVFYQQVILPKLKLNLAAMQKKNAWPMPEIQALGPLVANTENFLSLTGAGTAWLLALAAGGVYLLL